MEKYIYADCQRTDGIDQGSNGAAINPVLVEVLDVVLGDLTSHPLWQILISTGLNKHLHAYAYLEQQIANAASLLAMGLTSILEPFAHLHHRR
jgi:hypothetical protein